MTEQILTKHDQIREYFCTEYNKVDWSKVRQTAKQLYHEAVFGRYAKKVKDEPFTGIIDDVVSNVRTVYVDGGRIIQLSKEWINSGYDTRSCLSATWGTYIPDAK